MENPLSFGVELLDRLYGATQTYFSHSPEPISCASLQAPDIPGASILSLSGVEQRNVIATASPIYWPEYDMRPFDICDVNITLTHPGDNDTVFVEVWLPLDAENWNGRFLGTGGAGFSAGNLGGYGFDSAGPVAEGYSTAWTDAGHDLEGVSASAWALSAQGEVNDALLLNFASRSIHETALIGKAITEQFYGRKPIYSYWSGCSTAGRQGYMEAQKYPKDYDGILATCAAINWPKLATAAYWPQLVMNQEQTFPTQCEFDLVFESIMKQCDSLDGLEDGVIDDPMQCEFDPHSLVGTTISCPTENITITTATAIVIQRILEGPRDIDGNPLGFGLLPGTSFEGLARTITGPHGDTIGAPFPVASSWIQSFLKKDNEFDMDTVSYAENAELLKQSAEEYNEIIGTNNPDLSAFHAAGGKMISWQGLADSLVFAQNAIDYRQMVEEAMGGAANVNEFYRLFLVPGGGHCMTATGVTPIASDILKALVAWVENGEAPDTLAARTTGADGIERTRDICPYPFVARYNGDGDAASADSFSCVESSYA